jgi:hypothetical protein
MLSNEFGWDEIMGGTGRSLGAGRASQLAASYQSPNVRVYLWGAFLWVIPIFATC